MALRDLSKPGIIIFCVIANCSADEENNTGDLALKHG
jgi:hypothetical protein